MIKKSSLLLLIVSSTFCLKAQNIDSLKNELKNVKHDTSRVKLMLELAENCELEDILKYAEPCAILAEKNISLTKDLKLKNFYSKYLSGAYNNIGYIANFKGNISKALDYYQKSLKIFEDIDDKKGVAVVLNNIGYIYNEQEDYTKALEYFNKSLDIKKQIDDKLGVAASLNNIGTLYANQGDITIADSKEKSIKVGEEKALKYHMEALAILEELKDKNGIAMTYNNIGGLFVKKNDISTALDYEYKALTIFEELNNKQWIAYTTEKISAYFLKQNKYEQSFEYAKRSLMLSKELKLPDNIKRAAGTLKIIYKSQNKHKEAFEMLELETQMADSIKNTATKKASYRNQIKYEFEKKSIADSVVNANEKFIASAKLSKERNQKFGFGSLALLTLGGIGFIFYQYKQKQKTNAQLTDINDKINKQNNTLKTLNTELIESEEKLTTANNSKEQLISMMSHDLLNPITAITNYNQQIISKKTSNEDLLQAFKTVDVAIQPMHSLLDNMLQWTAIQKDGIAAKLKMQDVNEIVKEIISIYRPQANLKFIKINDALQDGFVMETDKSILSLILRNLLNNAIKYSANDTTINIATNACNKTITIQDQGFGMTDEMIANLNNKQLHKIESKGSGLGLKLCYEFAEVVGAKINFEKKKKGIVVIVNLN